MHTFYISTFISSKPGQEQFDLIVASDVLLSCCGAPESLPAVIARRLKPHGQALLLNALRGAPAQLLLDVLLGPLFFQKHQPFFFKGPLKLWMSDECNAFG